MVVELVLKTSDNAGGLLGPEFRRNANNFCRSLKPILTNVYRNQVIDHFTDRLRPSANVSLGLQGLYFVIHGVSHI